MKTPKSRSSAPERQPICRKQKVESSEPSALSVKSPAAVSEKRRIKTRADDAQYIAGKAILYTKDSLGIVTPILSRSSRFISSHTVRWTYLLKTFAIDFDLIRPPHTLIKGGIPTHEDDAFNLLKDDPPDGFVFSDYVMLGYQSPFSEGLDGCGMLFTGIERLVIARYRIRKGSQLAPEEALLIASVRQHGEPAKKDSGSTDKSVGMKPCDDCGWVHGEDFEYMIHPRSKDPYFLTGEKARYYITRLHESLKRAEPGLRNKDLYREKHPYGELGDISDDFSGEKMGKAYDALIDRTKGKGIITLKRPI